MKVKRDFMNQVFVEFLL